VGNSIAWYRLILCWKKSGIETVPHVSLQSRIGIALLSLLWLSYAQGAPITLSCTLPTQNTDGTPLTDLAGIRFYEAQVLGGPYTQIADQPGCTVDIDKPAGDWYFVATAYNAAGVDSAYSNEVLKNISSIPAPPSGLTVTGSLLAYGLSQTKDVLTTYPVGRVPLGTACDTTMQVNGMYQVSFDLVAWVGTARPVFVVAECG